MDLTRQDGRLLDELFRHMRSRELARAEEVTEDRGTLVDFCETKEVDKGALALVRKLAKTPQLSRERFLTDLDRLLTVMQPIWDGEATPDMFSALTIEQQANKDAGLHPYHVTPDEVEGLGQEFDAELRKLEADDASDNDEPGEPTIYEEAALRNHGFGTVQPLRPDAA